MLEKKPYIMLLENICFVFVLSSKYIRSACKIYIYIYIIEKLIKIESISLKLWFSKSLL